MSPHTPVAFAALVQLFIEGTLQIPQICGFSGKLDIPHMATWSRSVDRRIAHVKLENLSPRLSTGSVQTAPSQLSPQPFAIQRKDLRRAANDLKHCRKRLGKPHHIAQSIRPKTVFVGDHRYVIAVGLDRADPASLGVRAIAIFVANEFKEVSAVGIQ